MLTAIAQHLVDAALSAWPQSRPSKDRFEKAQLVAHRGAHDHPRIIENTLAAFDLCLENHIWGIELDIRWTKDQHPVILHDPTAKRLFNRPDLVINEVTWEQLHREIPLIPRLSDILRRYGHKMHLMIELKEPCDSHQQQILKEHLHSLQPIVDYHLLALDPDIFESLPFVPQKACLPVALAFNTTQLSQIAIERKLAGLSGHYLLLHRTLQSLHQEAGQKVGTGFIASKNVLYRELNRGVEWIFTNRALKLQKYIDSALQQAFASEPDRNFTL